jgi:membrane protein DedA with SNARE-associated domain
VVEASHGRAENTDHFLQSTALDIDNTHDRAERVVALGACGQVDRRRPHGSASQYAVSGGDWRSMSDLGQLIAYWGYPAIFIVVVLGNIGLPVPEETTLIVAGYLVWQGYFRLPIVLAVGVISAVVGDNIGYWVGRRYGPAAVARVARWAALDAERMESMRRFMVRHGALAVFLGRFFPGLRFMAGPLAGAAGLGFRSFFVANILGAVVFVPYGVGLGYALGYGLAPYVAEIRLVERALLAALILFLGGLVGWRLLRSILRS